MLNKSRKKWAFLSCSWSQRKCFQFFIIEYVSFGFVIYDLYYVEVCSLDAPFLENFYQKWMLNFVKNFLCIYWDDHMAFTLQFVNVEHHTDWFVDIHIKKPTKGYMFNIASSGVSGSLLLTFFFFFNDFLLSFPSFFSCLLLFFSSLPFAFS